MATNVAIVDDRDPAIQYSLGWTNAGSFIEFAETTRWSAIPGSTASLSFTGTSVTVYGSVSSNPSSASLGFLVDNSLTGSYTPTPSGTGLFHQALWTSPTLSDSSHTLVITQTTAQASGVIFLDYIQYNTSLGAGGTTYFIDDRDPRIIYTPAWRQFGSENDFQHTSSESTNPGDSFSLEFEGTGISYYGGLTGLTSSDAGFSIASILLDGGAPTIYTAPNSLPATTNFLIFKSGQFSAGESHPPHYFLVTPSPSTLTNTITPSVSGSASPSSPKVASSPIPNSKLTPIPVPGLVGGTLGALVFAALLSLAALLLIRRRRRRSARPALTALPEPDALTPYPYRITLTSISARSSYPYSVNPPSTQYFAPPIPVTHSRRTSAKGSVGSEVGDKETVSSKPPRKGRDGEESPPDYSVSV
ncbi:hypothetical protein B0H14DRAFT_3126095 [Mycena olivaceomarginata]|nr:hypothetical protein B0H14DRAFT_3126095 [Mycena olivaceomarginata]